MRILANLTVSGTLDIDTVLNANADTDRFLVQDANGVVKFRTGSEILSDIGAASAAAGLPIGGTAGQILAKIDGTNYNTQWIDNFTPQVKHLVKLGETMTAGTPVYVSSSDGTNMIVSKASNSSESTSSKVIGLLQTGGVTNDQRYVITEGLIAGLDTSTATAGDPVWLGVGGALIFGLANKPVAPANLVYIGVVTRVQSNNGEIFVSVQNGYELDELHDVSISTYGTKDILWRDTSTNLWKNRDIFNLIGAATTSTNGYLTSTDWNTFNNKYNLPTLTTGSVLFSNGTTIAQDNANFFWDDTNNRLGIGTATPSYQIDATGSIRAQVQLLSPALYTTNVYNTVTGNNAQLNMSASGARVLRNVADANAAFGVTQTNASSTGPIQFWANNGGQVAVMTQTGNLLIGSTTDNLLGDRLQITGSAAITGNLAVDTNTLFVDATNNRVGIGTTSPVSPLQIGVYTVASGGFGYGAAASFTGAYSALRSTLYLGSTDTTDIQNKGGSIDFGGATGAASSPYVFARIQGLKELASNGYSGYLSFCTTPSGSNLNVERMRISSVGAIRFNNYGSGTNTGTVAYNLAVDSSGNVIETAGGVVDGSGTANYIPKWSDPNTLTDSNIQDDGTLITLGSNSYVNGNLGLGTTSLTNTNLRISRNLTGSTTSIAVYTNGQIQSDVTGRGEYFSTLASTQATTFTLSSLSHYRADQGTFGAGSTVSNQQGFNVTSTLIGATNNYGFRGQIPSGTGRWNIYMDGTAINYLNGALLIGTTTDNTIDKLQVSGSANITGNLTVDTNTFFVDATNNRIGIGTTSPAFKVDIRDTANSVIRILDSTSNNSLILQGGSGAAMKITGYNYSTSTAVPLYVSVDGANTIMQVNGGNVGIGTTSPSEKLDVSGVIRGLYTPDPLTGAVIAKFLAYSVNPYGFVFRSYTSGINSIQVQRESNNSQLFGLSLQPLGGNILLGTTTDNGTDRLQVSGNISSTNGVRANAFYLGTTGQLTLSGGDTYFDYAGTLNIRYNFGATQVLALSSTGAATFSSSVTTRGSIIIDDLTNGRITFENAASQNDIYSTTTGFGAYKNLRISSNELILSTGGTTERLRIASTGAATFSNTVTATNTLNVLSSGTPTAFIKTTADLGTDATLYIGGARTANSTADIGAIQFWNYGNQSTGGQYAMGVISGRDPSANSTLKNGALVFQTSSGGTLSESMRINTGGNVLIGSTTDNSLGKLQVNGNINISSASYFRYDGDTGVIGSGASITGGNTSQLGIRAANDILFATNGANERMRITSAGNVGIGVTAFDLYNYGNYSGGSVSNKLLAYNSNTYYGVQLDSNLSAINFGVLNSVSSPNIINRIVSTVTSSSNNAESGYLSFFTKSGAVSTASQERMRIDASGNLGLGVTPSAWGGGISSAFEGRNGSGIAFGFSVLPVVYYTSNAYYDGTNWIYKTNNKATLYVSDAYNGGFTWNIAPSGTAGNAISFTQAMTLDASGRLGIGTTSANGKLTVKEGTTSFEINTDATISQLLSYDRVNSAYRELSFRGSIFTWNPSDVEKMRLDNSGNLGIGTTSANGKLTVYGGEIGSQITFTKDAPSGAYGRLGQDGNGTFLTQNASWNGSTWSRDNTAGAAMALALHNVASSYQFRIAGSGANPITWITALTLASTGAATFSSSVTAEDGLRSNRTSDGLSGLFLRSTINGSTIPNNGIILGKATSSNNAASIVYTHSSDGSTSNRLGFGFWANDNLVNILASGNVLIGTTADNTIDKLQVSGNIRVIGNTSEVVVSGSGSSNTVGGSTRFTLYDTTNARGWIQQQNASYNLSYWHNDGTSWSNVINFTPSGGATFSSSVTASGQIKASLNTTYDSENGSITASNGTTPAKAVHIGYDSAIDGGYISTIYSGVGWKKLILQGGGGNVGVGTTTPYQAFHVFGNSSFGSNKTSGVGAATISLIGGVSDTRDIGYVYSGAANREVGAKISFIGSGNLSSYQGGYLTFFTSVAGETTFNERMRIADNGNVGIGTTSPANRLDVVRGTAGAMGRGTYESASFSYDSDMKLGVYTAATTVGPTSNGASIIFGATAITAGGNYPGFELQFAPSTTISANFMRFNYVGRNSSGTVVDSTQSIMCVHQGNFVTIGTATNNGIDRLQVSGTIKATAGIDYNVMKPTTTTTSSTSTLTPNLSLGDTFTITAQAAALSIANPTGTPVNGQKMIIRIEDNGVARAITWSGSQYRASSDLALPTTTIAGKTLYMGFMWNSTDSRWDLLALLNNF